MLRGHAEISAILATVAAMIARALQVRGFALGSPVARSAVARTAADGAAAGFPTELAVLHCKRTKTGSPT